MGDLRQSETYAKYLEQLGWKFEKVGRNFVYIKKIPLIGSFVKIQRPFEIDADAFSYVYKNHKAFQIIIEPSDKKQVKAIQERGFKLSTSPYLPTKTLHLDLSLSINELYDRLEKDVKYSLRKSKGIKIYSIENTDAFRDSWKKAVGPRRWVPPISHLDAKLNTFKKSSLFLITPGGESGAIFLHSRKTVYYWQAFSSQKGRRMLSQYKIVWTGINWAKKRGAKLFDFEGIYDERFPQKGWKGFTHFKKSFGGYDVEYPGAFAKIRLPR